MTINGYMCTFIKVVLKFDSYYRQLLSYSMMNINDVDIVIKKKYTENIVIQKIKRKHYENN